MATTETDFADWLNKQIAATGMTFRQVARRTSRYKTSHSTISNVISGHRRPGHDFCNAIAEALQLPPDTVFRRAGLLPPAPSEFNPIMAEIVEAVKNLPDEDQVEVLEFALWRYRRQGRQGQRSSNHIVYAQRQATIEEEIARFLNDFPELREIVAEAQASLSEQALRALMTNVRIVHSSPAEQVSFKQFYGKLQRLLTDLAQAA